MATMTNKDRTRALDDSQRRIRHPLSRLRNYIRLYVGIEGILLVLIFLAVWFWLGLLTDYGLFALTRADWFFNVFKREPLDWVLVLHPAFRWGFLAILVGIALAIALVSLAFRAFRDFRDKPLALVLERRFPKILGDRLITAIELADVKKATQQGYSQEMVEETILEAQDRVAQLPVGKVFNWGRLVVRFVVLVLLVGGLAAVVSGTSMAIDLASSPAGETAGVGWLVDVSGRWAERNILIQEKPWDREAFIELPDFPASGDLRIPRKGGAPPNIRARAWKWIVEGEKPGSIRQMRWSDLQNAAYSWTDDAGGTFLGTNLPALPAYLKQGGENPTIDFVEIQLGKLDRLEQVHKVIERLDQFTQAPAAGVPNLPAMAARTVIGAAPGPASAFADVVAAQQMKDAVARAAVSRVSYHPHGDIRSEMPNKWLIVDEKTQKRRALTWGDLKELGGKLAEKVSVPDLPAGWDPEVDSVESQVADLKLDELRPLQRNVLDPLEALHASGKLKGQMRKLALPERLVVISRGDTTFNETPLERKGDNEYGGTLNNLTESVRFQVKGKDYFTAPRSITLVPKPRMIALHGDQYQPAYLFFRLPEGTSPLEFKEVKQLLTNREVSLQTGDTAHVDLPAGTDLVLNGKSDKPLLRYKLSTPELSALSAFGLSEETVNKLKALKDIGFATREQFQAELARVLDPVEVSAHQDIIAQQAAKSGVRIALADKAAGDVSAVLSQTGEFTFQARFTDVRKVLDFNFELTDTDSVSGVQHILINPVADRAPTVDVKVFQRADDQKEVLRRTEDGPFIVSAKAYLPFMVHRQGLQDDRGLESVDFAYSTTLLAAGGTGDSLFLQIMSSAFDASGGMDMGLGSLARLKGVIEGAKASARDQKNLRRLPIAGFVKAMEDRAARERWPLDAVKAACRMDPAAWEALRRNQSGWAAAGFKPEWKDLVHPEQLPERMLHDYPLRPELNPNEVAEHDFLDLRALRLPGWDDSVVSDWTKLELNVEAVDTDVLTGPHRTLTKETFTFLVVDENRLIAEIYKEEEKKYDELRRVIESLKEASKRLDPVVAFLNGDGGAAQQEAQLLAAGVELQRAEGTVHTSELDTRKLSRDFQRIALEMKYNRVSPETLRVFDSTIATPTLAVFGDLKEGETPKDRPTWTYLAQRDSLRATRVPLDPESLKATGANLEEIKALTQKTRDAVVSARDDMDRLAAELKKILDSLQGIVNDQRLIAELVMIADGTRIQGDKLRDLEQSVRDEVLYKLGLKKRPGSEPTPMPMKP